ncbi:MAG: hypothetical protein D6814_00135, partial [Calditrichaeota bacterium]
RSAILYTEYTAEVFANNPAVSRFSYNSQRLSQGLKLLGPWNLVFDLAIDFSLSKRPPTLDHIFLKEYASWKVIFGVNYQLHLGRKQSRFANKSHARTKENEELPEEVNEKRKQIQEELKRMEKSLEKEKKKENHSNQ